MIMHQESYQQFIQDQGVGKNDNVADSIQSYISYLKSISKHLDIEINSQTLSSEADIAILSTKLFKLGVVSDKTIKNYGSAMKQYVKMLHWLASQKP